MEGFEYLLSYFGNKYRMAKALDVDYMRIQQWDKRQSIPTEWAIKIEKLTGGTLMKERIKPDVFGNV
jgi:DNA-binding transcriptional regulator YdaS (Cro superfamily)